MSVFQRIQRWWAGLRQNNTYALDVHLPNLSSDSATQENRLSEETTGNVLVAGLSNNHIHDSLYQSWISLSPREQEVTALTCLAYTNRQIAFLLGLSVETVKSYLQNVLRKLDLHSKTDLRVLFANWDFSAWDTSALGRLNNKD
jgi:DNA-binding CsgD family transcriptional regulator